MYKIDEETQSEMDWYGVDTVEDLRDIREAESDAHHQMEIDEIASEIEAGKCPNQKDIAWLLRNYQRADIPQAIRDYISMLLLGENLGGSQRNSMLSPDGSGLMKFSGKLDVNKKRAAENFFGVVPDFYALKSVIGSQDALATVAKASLLGFTTDFNRINYIEAETEKLNYTKKIIDDIENILAERLINEKQENEWEDKLLPKEINRISQIIYPRKK